MVAEKSLTPPPDSQQQQQHADNNLPRRTFKLTHAYTWRVALP